MYLFDIKMNIIFNLIFNIKYNISFYNCVNNFVLYIYKLSTFEQFKYEFD